MDSRWWVAKKKKKNPPTLSPQVLETKLSRWHVSHLLATLALTRRRERGVEGGGGWGVEFEYNVIEPGMSVALTAASIIVSGHQRTPKVPLKGPPIAGVPLECLRAPRQKNARAPERKRQESGRGQETCQVTEGVQPKSKSQVYVM